MGEGLKRAAAAARATRRPLTVACEATTKVRQVQCKACPWKVSTVPERDIPGGYSEELHKGLARTIAKPGSVEGLLGGPTHMMTCHETTKERPHVCAGWLMHQLGPGNNLALRMRARAGEFGDLNAVKLDGEQHETFEQTLPKPARKRRGVK